MNTTIPTTLQSRPSLLSLQSLPSLQSLLS